LVTSALPHLDIIHLVFNLYWLWVFGTLVEGILGWWRTAGLLLLFAAGSAAAEYALFEGGVGLSGVGYGLFGLLLVLSRKDPRFAGAMDSRTVVLFLAWFVLCCVLTARGVWKVGNAAHAMGAVLGVLMGFTLAARGPLRAGLAVLLTGTVALAFLGSGMARPYVNLAKQAGPELAYLAYYDQENGRLEAAVDKYRRALESVPGQADWWYNLGTALTALHRTEEAAAAFQRAFDLKPSSPQHRRGLSHSKARLGYLKQQEGNPEEAVRLYQEALTADERDALCWYNLGTAYQELGRTRSAREAYRRAAELDPADEGYREAAASLAHAADEPAK
jgi:GlpG protein